MNRTIRALHLLTIFMLGATTACDRGTGQDWDNLIREASSLSQKGQYGEAEVVAKKALEVAERTAGPEHPDVATSLNNLALLYDTQGKYAEAEPLYKRSLTIWEKALGPEHPDVATFLENLAALYRDTNRQQKAQELKQRAQRIRASDEAAANR